MAKRKVLQIGYEPERDRLTFDGWDIHCGHCLDVLVPDRLGGATWRTVRFEYGDGWYLCGDKTGWTVPMDQVNPVGLWAREVE